MGARLRGLAGNLGVFCVSLAALSWPAPSLAQSGPATVRAEPANATSRVMAGARVRYIMVPRFYMNVFASGGTTVHAPALGPELTLRGGGFEYVLAVMYTRYAMSPTPFKAKSADAASWEIADADLHTLYFMADLLRSAAINPRTSIVYGGGFGLAPVFGTVHTVQAYPRGDVNDPGRYARCPADPSGVRPAANAHPFCGEDNQHYGNYSEPSWSGGGARPNVFPWMSVQSGLRFRATPRTVLRLDVGWNLFNGPFVGLAGGAAL
jgi:hypothetical protein